MLKLVRQPLDHLLGLDCPDADPDAHAVFGYAVASRLQLWSKDGQIMDCGSVPIVGIHRSDDQTQARPGGMDLEFSSADGDLVVDLAQFVEHRLTSIVSGWGSLVIALCNPDELDLASTFRPLLCVMGGPLYWATGVVQASCESPAGFRILEAVRWYQER